MLPRAEGAGNGPVSKVRSKNGASGMSDIEGSEPDWHLAARVAASECGQRASFNDEVKSRKVFIKGAKDDW